MQTCQLAGDIQSQRAGTLLLPSGNHDFRPPITPSAYCRLHRDLPLGLLGHLCNSFYGKTDSVRGCGNAQESKSPKRNILPQRWLGKVMHVAECLECKTWSLSHPAVQGLRATAAPPCPWAKLTCSASEQKLNWPCGFSGSGKLRENWVLASDLSDALWHAQPLEELSYSENLVLKNKKKPQTNKPKKNTKPTQVERFVEGKGRLKPCGNITFYNCNKLTFSPERHPLHFSWI